MSDAPDDFRCTLDDMRSASICAPGARQWFRAHGLDLRKCHREGGMWASELRALDDAYANLVLHAAERRRAAETKE